MVLIPKDGHMVIQIKQVDLKNRKLRHFDSIIL